LVRCGVRGDSRVGDVNAYGDKKGHVAMKASMQQLGVIQLSCLEINALPSLLGLRKSHVQLG